MDWIFVGLNAALCLVLMGLSYYRLNKANETTRWEVRWSYSFLIVAALSMGIAPFIWATTIDGPILFLEACFVMLQLSTLADWRFGTPLALMKRNRHPAAIIRYFFRSRGTSSLPASAGYSGPERRSHGR